MFCDVLGSSSILVVVVFNLSVLLRGRWDQLDPNYGERWWGHEKLGTQQIPHKTLQLAMVIKLNICVNPRYIMRGG